VQLQQTVSQLLASETKPTLESVLKALLGGRDFLISPKYTIVSHERRAKNIKSELGYYVA
jgi:hypothetical protein